VPSGKLLGFIISNRRIEANPVKITAITGIEAPATIKDVQKLTGSSPDSGREDYPSSSS
jgi:hypothetical protein